MPGLNDLIEAFRSIRPGSTQPPLGQFAQFASFGGGLRESYTDFMMSERCLIETEVPLVPQLDGNYIQIVQSGDHVVLRTEFSRRIIALGGGARTGDNLRQWTGISRGRWEGETLVVETRNFNDRLPSFAGAGTPEAKS